MWNGYCKIPAGYSIISATESTTGFLIRKYNMVYEQMSKFTKVQNYG